MVGNQPYTSFFVKVHVPDSNLFGHLGKAPRTHGILQGLYPTGIGCCAFTHIDLSDSYHPDVSLGIHTQLTVLTRHFSGAAQEIILPQYHVLITVEAEHLTVEGTEIYLIAFFGITGQTEVVVKLLRTIAEVILFHLLRHGIQMPEALIIGLHPDVLLAVNEETLRSTFDTHFVQPRLRMAVKTFRQRVKDGVVHTLLQPQLAVVGLIYLIDIVASQRRGILRIREECLDTIAVVAVQSIRSTNPHEAMGISIDTQHL